jgi:hypothetical protein
MRRAYKAMLDVFTDGGGKECGLLRHETDLRSEPFHIPIANVDAVQAHRASEGIIKPLDQRDDGRFARSRSTYECCGLACGKRKAEVLNDLDVWARGVIEVNSLKGNFANDCARLKTLVAGRIDRRDQIDSGIDLCCCPTTIGDSYE